VTHYLLEETRVIGQVGVIRMFIITLAFFFFCSCRFFVSPVLFSHVTNFLLQETRVIGQVGAIRIFIITRVDSLFYPCFFHTSPTPLYKRPRINGQVGAIPSAAVNHNLPMSSNTDSLLSLLFSSLLFPRLNQAVGERNFAAFYLLQAAAGDGGGDEYAPYKFAYCSNPDVDDGGKGGSGGDGGGGGGGITSHDARRYQRVAHALHCLGVSDSEQTAIFDVLRAVLQLGNVRFVQGNENGTASGDGGGGGGGGGDGGDVGGLSKDAATAAAADTAARLVGVDVTTLTATLLVQKLRIGRAAATVDVPRSAAAAAEQRDSLAK
jgi:hypothetical protein